jgi:hypothetical protein
MLWDRTAQVVDGLLATGVYLPVQSAQAYSPGHAKKNYYPNHNVSGCDHDQPRQMSRFVRHDSTVSADFTNFYQSISRVSIGRICGRYRRSLSLHSWARDATAHPSLGKPSVDHRRTPRRRAGEGAGFTSGAVPRPECAGPSAEPSACALAQAMT